MRSLEEGFVFIYLIWSDRKRHNYIPNTHLYLLRITLTTLVNPVHFSNLILELEINETIFVISIGFWSKLSFMHIFGSLYICICILIVFRWSKMFVFIHFYERMLLQMKHLLLNHCINHTICVLYCCAHTLHYKHCFTLFTFQT